MDLGLVPCPRHLPGLAVEIFREVPFVLVCLPEHPLARLPMVTLAAQQTTPVNGRVGVEDRPDQIWSAHDNLFTSGTLGRYSKILNSVIEKRLSHSQAVAGNADREEYVGQ